jgi:hypothetical protein
MSKYARILEIKDNRVILGLLNDTGLCGSGKCEGCSCSTKMQTMKLPLPENSPLTTGMDVEMIALGGGILGFAGSALLLKLLRKNQTIELVALSRDDQV